MNQFYRKDYKIKLRWVLEKVLLNGLGDYLYFQLLMCKCVVRESKRGLTCFFRGLTAAISTYRGKNGIIEHILAGGLTGMLYKFPTGPRASLVGGGLGNYFNCL